MKILDKKSNPSDPVRIASVQALVLVQRGVQTDEAIEQVCHGAKFRPIDMRFLRQLVNGTVKMRRRLDHEIKFYLARPSVDLPLLLASILRLGFYQLHFTDRIPAAAAVNEAVNMSHHLLDKARANLVNAVMRSAIRQPDKVKFVSKEKDPVKHLGDFYSYPDYFVKYCLREFRFDNTVKLLERYNQSPHVTYRVNYLKAKPEEVAEILKENGIEFTTGKYFEEYFHIQGGGLPLEQELIQTGKIFVQDESAGFATRLLNPKPGTRVADLAAAPGGKASHMAIRMRNKGSVTAVDKSNRRLNILVDNCKRLGIKIVAPVICDLADFMGDPFDRVLLDPPCTGWGTAGKHSDLRWSKTYDDVKNLSKIQAKLLAKAAQLVKPGGILIYSTCTIIRKENDQVVEEFLANNDDFQVSSADEFFGDDIVNARGFVKTYPTIESVDGAFCARLKRKE